jgi:ATPase subunit of ABC transporter with duplicated ATPase domains
MSGFVTSHDGPVLIASHDRHFLDDVATNVVELDLGQRRIGHYGGNYSDFAAARELVRRQADQAYADFAGTRDALVAQSRLRHEWATKGQQAVKRGDEPDKHLRERDRARADKQGAKSARLRRSAERLLAVEQPRKEWQLRYSVQSGPAPAAVVATLSAAAVRRGDFQLGPVDLTLGRGDRIAVSGDNGSGKTTLLAALVGEAALSSGRQSLGARVSIGVLDQQRSVLESDLPLHDVVCRVLGQSDREAVRTLLAKFGLGVEHVDRPGRTLSMGERTRALMATFQARAVNVLVLDEPTNHLDVPAIEQLESALASYDGTLLVVSHYAAFVDALGITHRWHVDGGQVQVEVV